MMLHSVLVLMLLIPIMRFALLRMLLVGLARRRRISVVVLQMLIKPDVLRSLLAALGMLLRPMALTLARAMVAQKGCWQMMDANNGENASYFLQCFILLL